MSINLSKYPFAQACCNKIAFQNDIWILIVFETVIHFMQNSKNSVNVMLIRQIQKTNSQRKTNYNILT